jgi:hypothetical protein
MKFDRSLFRGVLCQRAGSSVDFNQPIKTLCNRSIDQRFYV